MNKTLDAIDTSHYWSSTANDIVECGGQHFTKFAYLRISYSAVLTGVLARLLSCEPYCQAVFPQVESIQLNLAKGGALAGLDDVECKQNVSKFVGRIKSMFPNASMCSVSNTMFCLPEEENASKHYSQLVTELAQNARRIKYYTSNEMFSIGTLVNICNLTHLVYSECNSTSAFIQLVLNNASTLQVLNLDLDNPELFTQFVYADTGMQVAYPCLHTLKSICTSDGVIERHCSPLHVPFPNLTHLTMTHSYPFANDALFRGNSTHMKHLALHLDVIDLLILDRGGVFEKNKFAKLSVLDLDINLIDQPFNFEFGQRISRILLEIAPNIESLRLNFFGFPYKESLQKSFALSPTLEQLKYLTIGGVSLTLSETVGVLRHLPKLSQLLIDPQTADYEEEGYEVEEAHRAKEIQLIDQLYLAKVLSHSALKHVIFQKSSYADMNGASHFACQLAILCPHVTCIRWGYHSSAFNNCCKENAADSLYSAHKKRLEDVEWVKVK
ncbi:hypothetical protein GGI17_000480 [Coemansia sp. S146]|nr:hypothetical protein GGI17_000480 [Coemansia sp. S146]